MMRLLSILALFGIFLISCNIPTIKTTWSKPGATQADFERDQAACEGDDAQPGMSMAGQMQSCLQKRGWMLIEEPVN